MKPTPRAPPAGVPVALFDAPHPAVAHDPLAHDPQALHVAVPHGQAALSPSMPPGPIPQTPKHLRDQGGLSMQSIQGMRGLHSARSVPDFRDLYEVPGLDIPTAPGDPFLYDYDFQDPLSPTFYDMPLSSSQTLVLTSELSSVGSAASGASSMLGAPPPPVEGLGIAEPGWPQLSPRSRLQQSQPRVTKKASKQTLRQKRSRANLDQAASERGDRTAVERPSSPAPSTSTSSSAALSPPFPTSPRSPTRAPAARMAVAAAAAPGPQPLRPLPTVRHAPSTPFPVRGKAAASPAMQSPMRPALSRPAPAAPRLQAAAAATALYTPMAPPPDASRRTSMAAAAAAAAASATQQSTPGARTPRVSPSTIVASVSSRGPQQPQGAASPTPAARMHSSSKLVSAASDSSPAKGMFSQAQAPLPLSELPRPVSSARKMPSNQSMRRNQARKSPNIIPEMSSAMNQFQVELKPQQPRKAPSMPSAAAAATHSLDFGLMAGAGDLSGAQSPVKKPLAPQGFPRSHSVGAAHLAPPQDPLMDMNTMFFDAPSHEQWVFGQQQPLPPAPPSHLTSSVSGMPSGVPAGPPQRAPTMPEPPHMHVLAPPPMPVHPQPQSQPHPPPQPQPQHPQQHPQPHPMGRGPQFAPARPKTVVPVSNETSRVHPQGEPPQHVWVAHPPPPRTPRRRSSRPAAKTSGRLSEPAVVRAPGKQPQHLSSSSAPAVPVVPPVPHLDGAPNMATSVPRLAPGSRTQPFAQGSLGAQAPPQAFPQAPPAQTSMADAPVQSAMAQSSLHPSMMQAGLAMQADMFSSGPDPSAAAHAPDMDPASAGELRGAKPVLQDPDPLSELNDGLGSDGDFGLGRPMDYSGQEFLDSLEWVPNELDTQWDFMDVLEPEI